MSRTRLRFMTMALFPRYHKVTSRVRLVFFYQKESEFFFKSMKRFRYKDNVIRDTSVSTLELT